MRAGSLGWHDALDAAERSRLRRALWISLGIHVGLVLMLVVTPPSFRRDLPEAISVELIAGATLGAPAAPPSAGRPKPPPPAPKPKAAPPPEPAPAPKPAPPAPKAPVKVLPENAPKPEKKVEQAPKEKPREVAKAAPKKAAPVESKAKPAEEASPESYDDVMKALEEELGGDETDDLLEAAPRRAPRTAAESTGAATSRSGVPMDPKTAAWQAETLRLIRSKWVTPSDVRGRGLVTSLELRLSASGKLMGEPVVVRSSGDPYFDDNAVAALVSIGQLPAPPHAGTTTFDFYSDEE